MTRGASDGPPQQPGAGATLHIPAAPTHGPPRWVAAVGATAERRRGRRRWWGPTCRAVGLRPRFLEWRPNTSANEPPAGRDPATQTIVRAACHVEMAQPPPPVARGADAARPDEDVTMTVWLSGAIAMAGHCGRAAKSLTPVRCAGTGARTPPGVAARSTISAERDGLRRGRSVGHAPLHTRPSVRSCPSKDPARDPHPTTPRALADRCGVSQPCRPCPPRHHCRAESRCRLLSACGRHAPPQRHPVRHAHASEAVRSSLLPTLSPLSCRLYSWRRGRKKSPSCRTLTGRWWPLRRRQSRHPGPRSWPRFPAFVSFPGRGGCLRPSLWRAQSASSTEPPR